MIRAILRIVIQPRNPAFCKKIAGSFTMLRYIMSSATMNGPGDRLAAVVIAALVVAAACGGGDDGAEPLVISEGAIAPDFTLPAANGQSVKLSDVVAEKNVLLYFSMGSG